MASTIYGIFILRDYTLHIIIIYIHYSAFNITPIGCEIRDVYLLAYYSYNERHKSANPRRRALAIHMRYMCTNARYTIIFLFIFLFCFFGVIKSS